VTFATLPPGSRLGRFHIVKALGAGGMGVVYEAKDTVLGRHVALKVLPGEVADDPRYRARFDREARAAASVDHPNVVRVHWMGDEGGAAAIALELVTGGTLKHRTKLGPLVPAEVVKLGREIAAGLEAIHAAGLVHRDLKPENVLLDGAGHAKVSDFGLVSAEKGSADRLTKSGDVVGTIDYMAPEQLDRAKDADARADLYSLGAVLYVLLAGRPPFEGTGLVVMTQILTRPPPPPSRVVPGIPPRLESLVLRLLEKDPAKRPQTAAAVAEELDAIARTVEGKDSVDAPRGRGLLAASVLSALVLGAGGLVALGVARSKEPTAAPSPPPAEVAVVATTRNPVRFTAKPIGKGFALLEPPEGAPVWTHGKHASAVAISRKGRFAASSAGSASPKDPWPATVKLWDLERWAEVATFEKTSPQLLTLAFSPDDRYLLVGGSGGEIRLVEVESGKVADTLVSPLGGDARSLAWGTRDRVLAGELPAKGARRVDLWDVASRSVKSSVSMKGTPNAVAFLGDADPVLVGTWNDRTGRGAFVWDGVARERPAENILDGEVIGAAASADGTLLAFAEKRLEPGHGLTIQSWPPAGEPPGHYAATSGDKDEVARGVAMTPDGTRVVMVNTRSLFLVDVKSQLERSVDLAAGSPVKGVAIAADGRRALTAHEDGAIRFWQLPD
jgi:hypothetical protein